MFPTKKSRYSGKAFLRLLELYVLWAIDEIDPADQERLITLTPKLSDTYNTDGEWHDIISATMEFPANMPDLVRQAWKRNQQIASNQDTRLVPQEFAEHFVDVNFLR